MYSRRRIDTIRKMKCVLFKGLVERPRQIYGGSSTSNFMETMRTHDRVDIPVLSKDDFKPIKPSFFIEWDKDAGQFKMVPEIKVKK